jgi:hypothetical protein
MNNSRRRESINTVENAKLYTAFKKEVEPYFTHKDSQSSNYDFPTLVDILKSIDICKLDPDYVESILDSTDIIIAYIDETEKEIYGFRTMRLNKTYEDKLVLEGGIFCTNSDTYVGIGHKIMCSSIKLALQNNIKEMRVRSISEAVGFYKKYGFKSQSEINNNTNYNIEKILENDYNHSDDIVKMKFVMTPKRLDDEHYKCTFTRKRRNDSTTTNGDQPGPKIGPGGGAGGPSNTRKRKQRRNRTYRR